MAPVLGLRDTVSYVNDRFQNYRRAIFYRFPNGRSPLTGFLSLTDPEETNDPHFNWYEKELATQRSVLTAAFSNVDTSISVAAANFRVGHQIQDEVTGEIMEITAVDSTGLILTVTRGKWGTAAASSGADDAIVIIGNINAEGGRIPQSLSVDPTPLVNYTQIFRTPISLTGTQMKTALKWDRTGPYKELSREALQYHCEEMEKAFIFSKKAEYADPSDGKTKRTTQGIIEYLKTGTLGSEFPAGNQVSGAWNIVKPADIDGKITRDELSSFLEVVFRICSNSANEKLVLCGSGALNALNGLAEKFGKMETVAGDDSFGMALTRWYTPFGTVYFRTHPLFVQHPVWRYYALFLDVHNLCYRNMSGRDTTKLTNRQNNDEDARKDEWLTECGLEVHHVDSHMLLTNLKGSSV